MSNRVWRRRRHPDWFHRNGTWWRRYLMPDGQVGITTSAILGGRRGGKRL